VFSVESYGTGLVLSVISYVLKYNHLVILISYQIGIIMAEEEAWYDVLVRRPDDDRVHQKPEDWKLPAPTELFTSIFSQAGRDGEDIKLVFKGYAEDSEEAMISSGLTQWTRTSDVLCNYLLNDDDIDIKKEYKHGLRLLELGSGNVDYLLIIYFKQIIVQIHLC